MHGEGQALEAPVRWQATEGDVALVEAIAAGDRDALATLYDQHGAVVLGLARRIVGPGAAEDLLHDVFLEVWHHAADYSSQRGSVRTWLLMRTRSRALDRLGKRARDTRMAEQVMAQTSDHHDVGSTLRKESELDARRVGHLATRLEPELTTVLTLAYYEGLSCSEIADKLAVPIGTVKSRMARALARLREAIGFHESGELHG